MGAISGHLNHLYDNLGLSFGKMKEIFSKAYSGELQVSEKVDGQNLFLSYSPLRKEPIVAINKTELRRGGMSINDLAAKYEKKPFIQEVFLDALEFWERAVNLFPEEHKETLFGEDGTKFYSAEILDPRSANVVNYGAQIIIIHPWNHVELLNDKVLPLDVDEYADVLRNAVSKVTPGDTEYSLKQSLVTNLKDLSDEGVKDRAISGIDSFIAENGLSNNHSIGDYLIQSFGYSLPESYPDDVRDGLIMKALGEKGYRINNILKPLEPEQKVEAKAWLDASKKLKKELIFPLEKIVHDFTVGVLQGMRSLYMLDNDGETEKLKAEVDLAIKAINKSDNPHAMAILDRQLKKLGSVDNITTASEGFVFEFEGELFKFTGNFAPINQILGLFKFGRGKKIPPMKNLLQENLKLASRLAVFPGGFKPPHQGHYNVAKYLLRYADKLLVYISPKARDNNFSAKQSKSIWDIFVGNDSDIEVEIAPTASPVKAVYDLIEVMGSNQTLILGIGEKDAETGDHRYKRTQGWADKKTPGLQVQTITVPNTLDFNETAVSSTSMREFVAKDQPENFMRNLPDHLSPSDKRRVWELATGRKMQITENSIKRILAKILLKKQKRIDEVATSESQRNLAGMALSFKRGKMSANYLKSLDDATRKKLKRMASMDDKELEKYASTSDEDIQEMSGMGAGAVAGGSGNAFHDERDELVNEVMAFLTTGKK